MKITTAMNGMEDAVERTALIQEAAAVVHTTIEPALASIYLFLKVPTRISR